jgi:hypothetical protein
MTIELDEADEPEGWPTGGDPDRISVAFGSVMAAIIESTPEGSTRAQAVGAVMEVHAAVRALLARSRLN